MYFASAFPGWPDCVASAERLCCEDIQRPWRECRLPEMELERTEGKRLAGEFDNPSKWYWQPKASPVVELDFEQVRSI